METMARAGKNEVAAKKAIQRQKKTSICVYTSDFEDLEDVRRVRQRLRELGYAKKIPYKTDAATTAGKYAKNGDKKISLLYE